MVSPAGKLPYTWYADGFARERGAPDNQDLRGGKGITYRWYTGDKVLLPFGWGLSYTRFRFTVAPGELPATAGTDRVARDGLAFRVTVQNTGGATGSAVVLVFAAYDRTGDGGGVGDCPLKTLGAFGRAEDLPSGASREVAVAIAARQVACVDATGAARIVPGTVRITLGAGEPTAKDDSRVAIRLRGPAVAVLA